MLKDDSDWAKTGLKDGAKVMMMGTAEKPIEAPQEEIKFLEDLPEVPVTRQRAAESSPAPVNPTAKVHSFRSDTRRAAS